MRDQRNTDYLLLPSALVGGVSRSWNRPFIVVMCASSRRELISGVLCLCAVSYPLPPICSLPLLVSICTTIGHIAPTENLRDLC